MHHNHHYFSGHGKHWCRWRSTNFIYSRRKPWFCCRCYYHRCWNNYIQAVQIISYFWNLKILIVKKYFCILFYFFYVLHWFWLVINHEFNHYQSKKKRINIWNRNIFKKLHDPTFSLTVSFYSTFFLFYIIPMNCLEFLFLGDIFGNQMYFVEIVILLIVFF